MTLILKPLVLCVLLGLCTAGTACRRKPTPAAPAPVDASPVEVPEVAKAEPAERTATVTSGAESAAASAAAARALADDLQFLTLMLREFVVEQKRMPKDFAELQNIKLDSPRQPPQGRKFVIDPATQTVRLQ